MVNVMMRIESAQTPPNLFEQINYPKDPNNMTDLEKKHWPRIECPDTVEANKPFDVTVNIGVGIDHPSELAHFIEWVSLGRGDGNMEIGRSVMTPVFSLPRVTFKVKLDKSTTLIARESCNLHGVWENKKQVTVK
jgi:superoxide reductase